MTTFDITDLLVDAHKHLNETKRQRDEFRVQIRDPKGSITLESEILQDFEPQILQKLEEKEREIQLDIFNLQKINTNGLVGIPEEANEDSKTTEEQQEPAQEETQSEPVDLPETPKNNKKGGKK